MFIPQEYVQQCNDMLTLVGLPYPKKENFEKHFQSNRKIITIYNETILEAANLQYFDAPEGDQNLPNGKFRPKRRFHWDQRILHLPTGYENQFDSFNDLIDLFSNDGFNDGYPLGFIIERPRFKEELLSLGEIVKGEYCTTINSKKGELKLYNTINVPIYIPNSN